MACDGVKKIDVAQSTDQWQSLVNKESQTNGKTITSESKYNISVGTLERKGHSGDLQYMPVELNTNWS
jgi:hypothetical protein